MLLLDAVNHQFDWGQQFREVTCRWLNNFTLYTINGFQQAASVQSQTSVSLRIFASPDRNISYEEKEKK